MVATTLFFERKPPFSLRKPDQVEFVLESRVLSASGLFSFEHLAKIPLDG
jgi:hypothetical protein